MTHWPIRRILVPTDFSGDDGPVYEAARRRAEAEHGEILLMHVLPVASLYTFSRWAEVRRYRARVRAISERLNQLARTRFPGVCVIPCTGFGRICAGICAEAEEWKADLIVMRPRRPGLTRLWTAGVTTRVCRAAPCPVLVVPPEWAEATAPMSSEAQIGTAAAESGAKAPEVLAPKQEDPGRPVRIAS